MCDVDGEIEKDLKEARYLCGDLALERRKDGVMAGEANLW
jgi:hypothetical protein